MTQSLARCVASLRKWTPSKPDNFVAALCVLVAFWGWSFPGSIWVAAMRPAPDTFVDYYQDWGSARNYWVGLPVYTPHSTSVPRHPGLPSNPNLSIEYNSHPPTSVLMALPLARLAYPDAVLVWNTISLVAFLVSLVIVAVVLRVPSALFLPGAALLPFCLPVFGNLQLGQLNLILVLLVTATWALERSGRSSTAGLLVGAGPRSSCFPPTWSCTTWPEAGSGRCRPPLFRPCR